MKRLIVTGTNGSGKTRLASRLQELRPEIPIISFDALKLAGDWKRRPETEVERALKEAVKSDSWILEGGPSLLPLALQSADAVIWLDPPEWRRAARLFLRPWRNLGRTRPGLPEGNR